MNVQDNNIHYICIKVAYTQDKVSGWGGGATSNIDFGKMLSSSLFVKSTLSLMAGRTVIRSI